MTNIEIKVGDVVMLKDGELPIKSTMENREIKHQGPYIVEVISGRCVMKMSGMPVTLVYDRFELFKEQDYEIY